MNGSGPFLLGQALRTKFFVGIVGFLLGVVIGVLLSGFLVVPEERLAKALINAQHAYKRCKNRVEAQFPRQDVGSIALGKLLAVEEECANEYRELEVAGTAAQLWRRGRR